MGDGDVVDMSGRCSRMRQTLVLRFSLPLHSYVSLLSFEIHFLLLWIEARAESFWQVSCHPKRLLLS